MPRSSHDYLRGLQGLLPTGAAWPRGQDATRTKLLLAWADEMARVDGRGDDLLDEADPATAFEMLPDWERLCGLPNRCSDYEDTLAERREAVQAILAQPGGQSPAYFVALALAHGYQITLEEFQAFTTETGCDQPIYGDDWARAWRLRAPEETVRYLDTGGTCAEALAKWGNERLECVITAVAPEHTILLFAYGD